MGDDQTPVGFAELVAALPDADGPSPREQRIAVGIAMVDRGATYTDAARECGLPLTTLWDRCNGLASATEGDTPKGLKVAESRILSLSLAASIKAGESIMEGLETEAGQPGAYRPAEVIKALQVSAHIVGRRLGWDKGPGGGSDLSRDALAGALQEIQEQLQQGAQITAKISIEQPDKAAEAIEVTATEVET